MTDERSTLKQRFDAVDETATRARSGTKWRRYGDDALAAWLADMDFGIPDAVRAAIVAMLDRGDLGYPDWDGGTPLREVFAERMRSLHGWHADPQRVRELSDIVQWVEVLLTLATSPGDAVALHLPTYPPFLEAITGMGRRLVPLALEDDGAHYVFDPEKVEAEIATAGCRVLVLVNPHNPTGRVFTAAELDALADIVVRRELLVISDEIHAELTYAPNRHLPFASLGDDIARRAVTLTSATKTFNIAGARCALAHVGDDELLARLDAQPAHLFGEPSTLGVAATHAAWTSGDGWLDAVREYLRDNRDHLSARVASELPSARLRPPEATYLAWLDLNGYAPGEDPATMLLREAQVALGRGPEYGPSGAGHVRLNFATSRRLLDTIVDRLVTALTS